MALSPVMPYAARGPDLVQLVATHVALHDAIDQRSGAGGARHQAPDPGAPLSAALVHPRRRPAFLAFASKARGAPSQSRMAQGGSAVAALPPAWRRMAADGRRLDAIAGHDWQAAPVQAPAVHGRRLLAAHDQDGAGRARAAPPATAAAGALHSAGALARKALLERARCLAPLLAAA